MKRIAIEKFDIKRDLLGVEMFESLYKDSIPAEFEIIDEIGDEICVLQPHFVDGVGETMLKIWTLKSGYIIKEIE